MFNFFKKNNKDKAISEDIVQTAREETPWGVPIKRKMSRKEEAAEAAEQARLEIKNRERRDMYRLGGIERIFNDLQGRRLALRLEDNTGPQATPGHPPLFVAVFWGARELCHIEAELNDGRVKLVQYRTERGYEGWGLPSEILQETEKMARTKGAKELCAPAPADQSDWDSSLFAGLGYQVRGTEMVKSL